MTLRLVTVVAYAVPALLWMSIAQVCWHLVRRDRPRGPGVPPDALPRLFEPFFSLKSHGTGLGLAIVKRTVDAHGGRIAAACPPGSGLTIRIELPLAGVTEG